MSYFRKDPSPTSESLVGTYIDLPIIKKVQYGNPNDRITTCHIHVPADFLKAIVCCEAFKKGGTRRNIQGFCTICIRESRSTPWNFLLLVHCLNSAALNHPKFSTDVKHIVHTEQATITLALHERADIAEQDDFTSVGWLRAFCQEDGELMVYYACEYDRRFAICLKSCYAESEKHVGERQIKLSISFKRHAPLLSPKAYMSCLSNSVTACLDCLLAFDVLEAMWLGLMSRHQGIHILGNLSGESSGLPQADPMQEQSIGLGTVHPATEFANATGAKPMQTRTITCLDWRTVL